MKKLALSLALSFMVTAAHAGDGKPSLLRCGIELAGTKMIYLSTARSKKKEDDAKVRAFAPFARQTVSATAFTQPKSGNTGRRMPTTLPIARLGCSW